MAGNIFPKYDPSSALTVTNLHSLAASSDWLTGWFSASRSNLSTPVKDFLYSGTFTTSATNRQAGEIRIYVVSSLNDTPLWTGTATGTLGTEGAGSFTDTEERDCLVRPLPAISVDNTASAIYTFPQTGIRHLFGDAMPTHHCLFIAHNIATATNAGLAASGSAIYMTPIYDQYT